MFSISLNFSVKQCEGLLYTLLQMDCRSNFCESFSPQLSWKILEKYTSMQERYRSLRVLTRAPSSHLQIAAAIVAYDKLIASELKSFGEACKAVGGIVEEQGKSVM